MILVIYNKTLYHVKKQSTMTEVIKILQTRSVEKSTNCEAFEWQITAHVQNPRDLKSAHINRLVAVLARELRHQSTRLKFPWKVTNFITCVKAHKIKMA